MARILVIEEKQETGNDWINPLLDQGHQVIPQPSGKKALVWLRENRIDLIITPILMPDMDGLELILEIIRNHPQTRIIAISGDGAWFSGQQLLTTARELGAHDTLAKPVEPTQLLEAVTRVLHSKGGNQTQSLSI
ncbi:MAG: response regulator [Magnetococcales bacterium]|nr:response regulator [Magnetococcales bacterium]